MRGYCLMRPGAIALSALLLLALSTSRSDAQVEELSLAEMIGGAGTIFSGTVLSVEGVTDGLGNIVTRTTFRVERPIRGVMPGMHTITQYGGVAPEGTMVLAHMRYFTEGERVFVLLYPTSELGYTSPLGMAQGAWGVDDDGFLLGVDPTILAGLEAEADYHGITPDRLGRVQLEKMVNFVRALTLAGEK